MVLNIPTTPQHNPRHLYKILNFGKQGFCVEESNAQDHMLTTIVQRRLEICPFRFCVDSWRRNIHDVYARFFCIFKRWIVKEVGPSKYHLLKNVGEKQLQKNWKMSVKFTMWRKHKLPADVPQKYAVSNDVGIYYCRSMHRCNVQCGGSFSTTQLKQPNGAWFWTILVPL